MEMLAEMDVNTFLNGENLPLMFFLLVAGIAVVTGFIAHHWRRVRVAEAEASLKLQMIERGYSAEDVERVLRAGLVADKHKRRHGPAAAQGCCTSDFLKGSANAS